jgi:hypothetical protein
VPLFPASHKVINEDVNKIVSALNRAEIFVREEENWHMSIRMTTARVFFCSPSFMFFMPPSADHGTAQLPSLPLTRRVAIR